MRTLGCKKGKEKTLSSVGQPGTDQNFGFSKAGWHVQGNNLFNEFALKWHFWCIQLEFFHSKTALRMQLSAKAIIPLCANKKIQRKLKPHTAYERFLQTDPSKVKQSFFFRWRFLPPGLLSIGTGHPSGCLLRLTPHKKEQHPWFFFSFDL